MCRMLTYMMKRVWIIFLIWRTSLICSQESCGPGQTHVFSWNHSYISDRLVTIWYFGDVTIMTKEAELPAIPETGGAFDGRISEDISSNAGMVLSNTATTDTGNYRVEAYFVSDPTFTDQDFLNMSEAAVESLLWSNSKMYKSSGTGMVMHDLTTTNLGVAPMNISFEINSTACIVPSNITIHYYNGSYTCFEQYKCTHQLLYGDSFYIIVDPDPNDVMDIRFLHGSNYTVDPAPDSDTYADLIEKHANLWKDGTPVEISTNPDTPIYIGKPPYNLTFEIYGAQDEMPTPQITMSLEDAKETTIATNTTQKYACSLDIKSEGVVVIDILIPGGSSEGYPSPQAWGELKATDFEDSQVKCVDRLECIVPATVVPIVGVALIAIIVFLVIKKPCSE